MAATMLIREKNGAGETPTDKTAGVIRFKLADDANVDTNDPMVVPGAGQSYSYRKVTQLNVDGTFTQVSNLRVYTDGSNDFGTGRKLWYAITGNYTQPDIPNESNDPPQFPGATPMADIFGLTSGAPGDMEATNSGPFDSTGVPKDIGDYMNMTFEVEPSSAQGVAPAEVLTFAWDEI